MLRFEQNILQYRRASLTFALPQPQTSSVVRKDEQHLTAQERQVFISAIQEAVQSGIYSQFVGIHANMMHRQHTMMGPIGTQRFLPWHRDFVFKVELALRVFEPAFFVPYWDWLTDRQIPTWLQAFLPQGITDPSGNPIVVVRAPGSNDNARSLPERQDIAQVMAKQDYTSFTLALEGAEPPNTAHNQVHEWVGGTMDNFMYSPADPLFWLHHAQVDRLWAIWQQTHSQEKPDLSGKDATLDPWTEMAADVLDINTLHYTYEQLTF